MKNFKLNIAFLAIFAMIFTSCSKEEVGVQNLDSEKVSLSFGAIVNDATTRAASSSSKQAVGEIPECSDDDPAYVRIVLMSGNTQVVGTTANPYKVDLAPGQLFTVEDPLLKLTPGTYTLTHFTVYNANDEVIWIAPRDGALAGFVDNPLPREIELNAGVKKYVEVDVLCFDNRDVNQYGYLFFEINTTEALEFCFFANFCDADGRHYAASYRLDVWIGTNANGTQLYSDLTNNVGINEDGDYFASPLCIALPTNADMNVDYIYYEITLMDWAENYGDVNQETNVLSGTLSRADIEGNFGENDEVEYEHLRFGCGDDDPNDGDADGDGVPDSTDECEDTPAGTNVNSIGCPEETDGDADADGVPDSIDECDNTPAGTEVNSVGCPEETDGDADADGVPDSIDECDNTPAGTNVDSVGCPEETDGDADNDGVPDSIDACPNTPSGTTVDSVGCPVDTSGCIDASQSVLTFSQMVDVGGFPVDTNPFYPLMLNGERVGTITFDLTVGVNENLIVLVDMFDGTAENQFTSYTVTTAELSLPGIDENALCVPNINQNEFSITWDRENVEALDYPLEVVFRANVLISME